MSKTIDVIYGQPHMLDHMVHEVGQVLDFMAHVVELMLDTWIDHMKIIS